MSRHEGTNDMSQSILVVDDSATVRKLVDRVFTRRGYQVDCAESGEQGLEAVAAKRPDLILVDFVMPGMYGHVFCRKAREIADIADVPIVLISSKGESIGYYFEQVVGVVHILTKPFEVNELIEVVERALPNAIREVDATSMAHDPSEREAELATVDVATAVDTTVATDVNHAMDAADTPMADTDPLVPQPNIPPDQPDENELVTMISDRVDRVVHKYFQAGFPQLMRQVMWNTLRESGLVQHENLVLSSSLKFLGLSDALSFVHQADLSGKVSVISDRLLGEIYVESGQFIFAKVSQKGEHEFLTDVLLTEVAPTDRRKAMRVIEQARMDNVLIGRRLVAAEMITKEQLDYAIHSQCQTAFSTILEVVDGHFFLESGESPEFLRDVPRMPMMQVLMNGLRVMDEKRRAQEAFEGDDDVLVRMVANHEDLDLTKDELELFEIIDGKKTLREIIACSHASELATKRACHRLILVGLVRKKQPAPEPATT